MLEDVLQDATTAVIVILVRDVLQGGARPAVMMIVIVDEARSVLQEDVTSCKGSSY